MENVRHRYQRVNLNPGELYIAHKPAATFACAIPFAYNS